MSRYGTTARTSSASAKSPSPVPRMIPTSARARNLPSRNAAASRIWLSNGLATSPTPTAERIIDPTFHLALVQSFHLDQFGARRGAPHHRHAIARQPEHAGQQRLDRLVRAPALGRRRDRELERAVPEPPRERLALRPRPHPHREPHLHPSRSASSCSDAIAKRWMNTIASMAMKGAKSIPPAVVGNSR